MPIYAQQENQWSEVSSHPDRGLSIQVRAEDRSVHPELRAYVDGTAGFALTGVAPRPDTETTHTVARIDPTSGEGTSVFAVHGAGTDVVFEEFEAPRDAIGEDALSHVQSALNEILVPVYIDDVVSDLSERATGLILVHTVQYSNNGSEWSYFRTSAFSDGDHAFESEHGSL